MGKPSIPAPPEPVFDAQRPVFIVCGGPSLSGFDFSRLDEQQVLAVNLSFAVLPHATAIYYGDRRFWHWHSRGLLEHQAPLYTARWATALVHQEEEEASNWFIYESREGLNDRSPFISHGNNSGYAAINVAYHLGARLVVMMGLDLVRGKDGKSHWHGGHPIKPNKDESWLKMRPPFETVKIHADSLGLGLFNSNPDSMAKGIPYAPLEQFL